MRFHADKITREDVRAAAQFAEVNVEYLSEHKSRKAARAFEIKIGGSSNRLAQGFNHHGEVFNAATWDEWGMFIAFLFDRNPDMIAGDYAGEDNFHYTTGWRFCGDDYVAKRPKDLGCQSHRWDFNGNSLKCKKCSAILRRV